MNFFQLVNVNPHRPWSPQQFANTSLCSLPIKASYGPLHQCVPECLIGECCCSHEFVVCALERSSSENCCAFHSSKKSSVPDSPAKKGASIRRKPLRKDLLWRAKTPSDVNVCRPSGSCPQTAAIVCRCAWLCSVIACHHLTLLIAISARADNTFHL